MNDPMKWGQCLVIVSIRHNSRIVRPVTGLSGNNALKEIESSLIAALYTTKMANDHQSSRSNSRLFCLQSP